jgi:hypothetical protein
MDYPPDSARRQQKMSMSLFFGYTIVFTSFSEYFWDAREFWLRL